MLALALMIAPGQLDLDCADRQRALQRLGRAFLAEIEQAEDAERRALAPGLAGCAPGDAGRECRTEARRQFDAAWQRARTRIEQRHRTAVRELEERCRGIIAARRRSTPI